MSNQPGKPKATNGPKSLEKAQANKTWLHPKTKRGALDAQDLGARISIDKPLYIFLIQFYQSIGADNELPSSKADRISFLNMVHAKLAINNPHWPEKMKFEFLYKKFADAVLYGSAEIKGHNVAALIAGFKNWITGAGVMDNLRREHAEKYQPDQKKLSDSGSDTPIEKWDDKTLKSTYEQLLEISGSKYGEAPIFNNAHADSYFGRLHAEYKKRFKNGPKD